MKKSIAFIIASLILASCSQGNSNIGSQSTNKTVKTGSTVSVDYVGKLEDGTIFDSSIESEAKKMTNYQTGRTFEPLSFKVGEGNMIKGFENGVMGMKEGEKKSITIPAKEAYGEEYVEQAFPKKYFEDKFTETAPRDNFRDSISRTVPKSILGKDREDVRVGDEIDAGDTKATVEKIEGDNITIAIANPNNPFYGKELKVGLEGKFEGNTIRVKEMNDKEVTVEVDNITSPFYKKELKVGLEGKFPNGENVKIAKIEGDNITLQVKNQHKLAGKTLIFDVTVRTIQ